MGVPETFHYTRIDSTCTIVFNIFLIFGALRRTPRIPILILSTNCLTENFCYAPKMYVIYQNIVNELQYVFLV